MDLEVQAEQQMHAAELVELRKLHHGIINIRPIYPELAEAAEERRLSEMSLTERFKLFVQRERGTDPSTELAEFLLEMVNEQREGQVEQVEEDATRPTGGEVA